MFSHNGSKLQFEKEDSVKHLFLGLLGTAILLTIFTEESRSTPAFARKYQTSCATCHNGFPKLNSFGEAFRRSGYQFPGGTDAQFTKEEPIPLGSDGNKRAFPDAIWPGSMSGSSPVALFLNGEADYNPKYNPADPTTAERFSFNGLGSSIEAVAAGTIGEDLSYWGQLALSSDGTLEINRVFLVFSNLIGSSYGLNARVGVIEPGLFSFSTHRAWTEGYWFTTRPFSGGMGWTLEETQKGIELNGILHSRFGYSAGVVEGFGTPHSDKDYYGHVYYKFDGLPLDGVVEGGGSQGASQPFIDNSFTIGAFAYAGEAALDAGGTPQQNNFTLFGGDYNAYYDRFNLFGGVQVRKDDNPFLTMSGTSAKSTVWFSELDVTVFPWLLPTVRYEAWNGQGLDANNAVVSFKDTQIVPGVAFLLRPNLKMNLRASFAKLNTAADANNNPVIVPGQKMNPGQVQVLMALGI
jgi:hypothetical protein